MQRGFAYIPTVVPPLPRLERVNETVFFCFIHNRFILKGLAQCIPRHAILRGRTPRTRGRTGHRPPAKCNSETNAGGFDIAAGWSIFCGVVAHLSLFICICLSALWLAGWLAASWLTGWPYPAMLSSL